ncbi:MAG: extensin family protein, partial [Pseudomonadota bacterium]
MKWGLFLVALITAGPALAEPRPIPRPDAPIVVMSSRGTVAVPPDVSSPDRSARPVPRVPEDEASRRRVAFALASPSPIIDTAGLVRRSDRPNFRPDDLILAMGDSLRRQPEGTVPTSGGICGRPSIRGDIIAPVPGRIRGCGIPNAVRVTQVSGVSLSTGARMDCRTAQALDTWVRDGVLPAVGGFGGGAVSLKVAAGYACRTRNNRPGGRISEHGRGRAIDISAVRLANGSELNVLQDWGRGTEGRLLRELWRAACGP